MHIRSGCTARAVFLAALFAPASTGWTAPNLPDRIEQVAVFPGAKPAPAHMAPTASTPSEQVRVLLADADIDKVFEFYRKQYPGLVAQNTSACVEMPAGGAFQEDYWTGKTGLPDHNSKSDDAILPKQQSLEQARRVRGARPGDRWRNSAELVWCTRPDASRYYRFQVSLRDLSFHRESKGQVKTAIDIRRTIETPSGSYSASATMEQEDSAEDLAEMQAEMAQAGVSPAVMKAMMDAERQNQQKTTNLQSSAPTEAELGVPPYPGALLHPQESAFRGAAAPPSYGYNAYVYYTPDSLEQLKAFYEQKTGKKAAPGGNGLPGTTGWTIIVRGKSAKPLDAGLRVDGSSIADKAQLASGMKTELQIIRCKSCDRK